jgi:hypothetical protein
MGWLIVLVIVIIATVAFLKHGKSIELNIKPETLNITASQAAIACALPPFFSPAFVRVFLREV